MNERTKYKYEMISITNPTIAKIIILLNRPKNKTMHIPPVSESEAISLFLSEQLLIMRLQPIKSVRAPRNSSVETVKSTENLRKLRMKSDTTDNDPARIALAVIIPNPIMRSPYVK